MNTLISTNPNFWGILFGGIAVGAFLMWFVLTVIEQKITDWLTSQDYAAWTMMGVSVAGLAVLLLFYVHWLVATVFGFLVVLFALGLAFNRYLRQRATKTAVPPAVPPEVKPETKGKK